MVKGSLGAEWKRLFFAQKAALRGGFCRSASGGDGAAEAKEFAVAGSKLQGSVHGSARGVSIAEIPLGPGQGDPEFGASLVSGQTPGGQGQGVLPPCLVEGHRAAIGHDLVVSGNPLVHEGIATLGLVEGAAKGEEAGQVVVPPQMARLLGEEGVQGGLGLTGIPASQQIGSVEESVPLELLPADAEGRHHEDAEPHGQAGEGPRRASLRGDLLFQGGGVESQGEEKGSQRCGHEGRRCSQIVEAEGEAAQPQGSGSPGQLALSEEGQEAAGAQPGQGEETEKARFRALLQGQGMGETGHGAQAEGSVVGRALACPQGRVAAGTMAEERAQAKTVPGHLPVGHSLVERARVEQGPGLAQGGEREGQEGDEEQGGQGPLRHPGAGPGVRRALGSLRSPSRADRREEGGQEKGQPGRSGKGEKENGTEECGSDPASPIGALADCHGRKDRQQGHRGTVIRVAEGTHPFPSREDGDPVPPGALLQPGFRSEPGQDEGGQGRERSGEDPGTDDPCSSAAEDQAHGEVHAPQCHHGAVGREGQGGMGGAQGRQAGRGEDGEQGCVERQPPSAPLVPFRGEGQEPCEEQARSGEEPEEFDLRRVVEGLEGGSSQNPGQEGRFDGETVSHEKEGQIQGVGRREALLEPLRGLWTSFLRHGLMIA